MSARAHAHYPPRRRQRMSQEGMLVQVDGSVHAWLEERGPRCTLLLAIDDATSTVPYALFRHEEDTHGYFLLMQELIRRCGVPLALYSDRHAVFKYVPGSHQSPAPTQFGRAMAELGVEQIFARSPEAKGRVERANGTFQDRLVTELRLAGARTISEANQVLWAFLTRFNKRFGVPPAQSTNAYRSPDPDLNLAGILCFKHSRKVARDNTVKYNWHTLQLLPSSERSTYVGAHVVVQERLDGKLVLQRQFREGCGVMPAWRRGAWHGSVWPVRYCPAYPQATAATRLARTVPGAAFPAPPGRPAAS